MPDTLPHIHVIIPTHNRCEVLRRCLLALCEQTYPPARFDVHVVLDGCTDPSEEMLQDVETPFALTYTSLKASGAASARNAGARRARGGILLFLDDDIVVAPSFVEAHARAHEGGRNVVAVGYSKPVLSGPLDFFRMGLLSWWEDTFHAMEQPGHRFTYRDLLSGNFSLSTRLFYHVGGFDASFRCREDYELGMRLIQSGADFTFVPAALGYHQETTDLARSLRRSRQEGEGDARMAQLYPDLIPSLPLSRLAVPSIRSRLLRKLAFQWVRLGDLLAWFTIKVLPLLEHAKARKGWYTLYHLICTYWYFRGVGDRLGSLRSYRELMRESKSVPTRCGSEIKLDLQWGLETAEQRLDERRPDRALIYYADQFVGPIRFEPGSERLSARHLRPYLRDHLLWEFVFACAMERVCLTEVDPLEEADAIVLNRHPWQPLPDVTQGAYAH